MSRQAWLAALAGLTLLRLVLAALIPLSPDETYYWLWSRHLATGYYDDAPLIALWIRAGTFIAGNGALGIRLLSPLSAAIGTLLLWRAGEDLFPNRRAGLTAALLLNATLVLNAGAIITTPDTPLLLFWTASLWAMARWLATGDDRWFLAAGLAAGLGFEAKYTAALLFVAIGLFMLATREGRAGLRRPLPWLGLLLGLLAMLPVVLWNAAHGWASFAKQGGRSAHLDLAGLPGHLLGLVGGQVGLATPIVLGLMAWGVWSLRRDRSAPARLVLLAVLVPAAVFVEHTLSGPVQANWPAILYPGAALAAGAIAPRIAHAWLRAAAALGFLLAAIVWLQAAAAPFPLPPHRDPTAIRLAGWRALARDVARAAASRHLTVIASTDYSTLSELAHDLPPSFAVVGLGPRWRFFAAPPAAPGTPVLLVEPSWLAGFAAGEVAAAVPAGHAARRRAGVAIESYVLSAARLAAAPAALMRPKQ